jgi:hypothetical protein
MGYTHYWETTKEVNQKEYAAALKDIAAIVESSKKILADGSGERCTKPETKDGIHFNGIGDDSHESFDLPNWNNPDFSFCKTAEKPYDVVVVACLTRLAEVKGISISSYGNDVDWIKGVQLASKTLGRQLRNPLGEIEAIVVKTDVLGVFKKPKSESVDSDKIIEYALENLCATFSKAVSKELNLTEKELREFVERKMGRKLFTRDY